MTCISFELGAVNTLASGLHEYCLHRQADDSLWMLPARCSHRGGPLRLGTYDPERGAIVCPWHRLCTSTERLRRGALPLVRNGNRVVVVISESEGLTATVARKNLLRWDASRSPREAT